MSLSGPLLIKSSGIFFISFINSNKKSKTKASKDFDNKTDSSPQPDMKELLGLCTGRFSDSEDNSTSKNTKQSSKVQECHRGALFSTQSKEDNFDELLGLCSGKFTDDEVDNLVSEEKQGGDTDIREKGEQSKGGKEDGVDGDDDDDKREVEEEEVEDQDNCGEKTDKEDESDPEEMILNRKYGKKYGSNKRYGRPSFTTVEKITECELLCALTIYFLKEFPRGLKTPFELKLLDCYTWLKTEVRRNS